MSIHGALTRRSVILLLASMACLTTIDAMADPPCAVYSAPHKTGRLQTGAITEASGMVAGRQQPGVFWIHNDSGDSQRLFAITATGRLLGEFQVAGAIARDWEDIAYGPCADGRMACLYIGDFGNNAYTRRDLVVYRVEEPRVDPEHPDQRPRTTSTAERFPFRYPDGERHNAEGLFVTPKGRIYILTKGQTRTQLLTFPHLAVNHVVTLKDVAVRDDLALATGADMAPDGSRFVVRTRHRAWEFPINPGHSIAEAFRSASITRLPLANERQGEAIAYSFDGKHVLTTSESAHAPVFRYRCTAAAH